MIVLSSYIPYPRIYRRDPRSCSSQVPVLDGYEVRQQRIG
jgi:hypothetical protein